VKPHVFAIVFAIALVAPAGAHAAEALAVDLPAGSQVRMGEYFPVTISLEEYDTASDAEILISVDDIAFSKHLSMSAGTSRKLLMWVLTYTQNPELSVEVRSAGRRRIYPELSRSLTEKLKVLPQEQQLVCILTGTPNPDLTQLFRQKGIIAAEVKPRLEFPGETFRMFDLIAFEGSLWNEMSDTVREGIETYLAHGGRVYISNREGVPALAPDGSRFEVLWQSNWGMGRLHVLNPDHYVNAGHPDFDKLKKIVLSATGVSGHRRSVPGSGDGAPDIFDAQPRYADSRPAWAVYLVVCCLVMWAAGACTMLRLWRRRLGAALLLGLSAVLSTGFSLVAPRGEAAYERLSLIVTAASEGHAPLGQNAALQRTFIHLTSFADIDTADFQFSAGGLILPPGSGWNGRSKTRLVLHNGDRASVSRLAMHRGESAIFELLSALSLEGGFEIHRNEGGLAITNNSGIDLHDCLLVSSGAALELGSLRFGETAELKHAGSRPVQEYFSADSTKRPHKGGVLNRFAEFALKSLQCAGASYLLGWSRSEGSLPVGYAQAADRGTLWAIELREGH
jgi:hypothetical protein